MVRPAVLYKKVDHIRKNLDRVKTRHGLSVDDFKADLDSQDVVLHNLQLAIQGCIDLGNHIISDEEWGVAGSFGDLFHILRERGVIAPPLAERMISAVGFRNILVHEYEEVDLNIAYDVYTKRLGDIEEFLRSVLEFFRL